LKNVRGKTVAMDIVYEEGGVRDIASSGIVNCNLREVNQRIQNVPLNVRDAHQMLNALEREYMTAM